MNHCTDETLFIAAFEKAIGTTGLARPYLARSLLGWQPRKAGLVDHLEIYYSAWKASEDL